MVTVDHPLLEAERAIESGFLDPQAIERARDEWLAGPLTPARLRESIFELLGEGWRGCVPVALEEVLDPEFAKEYLGVRRWLVLGVVDDGSVLKVAEGWFGPAPSPDRDRDMVLVVVDARSARSVRRQLSDGRKPVWAVPATKLFPMGSEREYRAIMAGERDRDIGGDAS